MSDIVVDSRTGAGEVSVNSEVLNGIVDGGGSGSGGNLSLIHISEPTRP